MCGVLGVFLNNHSTYSTKNFSFNEMFDEISHRGPDHHEQWSEKDYMTIGHHRLTIVDNNIRSNQPFITSNGRYVLAYNGEIYNFLDIKEDLIKYGYIFKTDSDTEVVATSYMHWGEDCVKKFNGMFAISIWDRKNKELFLARDRTGIKPLYFYVNNGSLFFSSEIKSLFKEKIIPKEICSEGLLQYFTFQNYLNNQTLFKNIFLFPAGHYLKINRNTTFNNNNDIEKLFIKYWDFKFLSNTDDLNENAASELGKLLTKSIDLQNKGDAIINSYLSSGLDSSIVSYLSKKINKNIKTFTIGFDTKGISNEKLIQMDETDDANKFSRFIDTDHFEKKINFQDLMNSINPISYILDEPRVGQSYPNYYAAELASKHSKVILSGTGADELFGGYPWRYILDHDLADYDSFLYNYTNKLERLLNSKNRKLAFRNHLASESNFSSLESVKSVLNNHDSDEKNTSLNECLYFESKTFLQGLLLVEDKISMNFSIENRVPFLDNDIIDFAQLLPDSQKVLKKNDQYINKVVLRDLHASLFPKSLIDVRKRGFSAPDEHWFRTNLADHINLKLLSKKSNLYEFFNHDFVKSIIDDHFEKNLNNRGLIWSLLTFERILDAW